MHLEFNQTMAMAIDQLVIDPQSRFLEMKSVQPYSTTDEYLYAMKEDLADWLSTMYPDWCPITADNFLERLENGVLLCQHANNVNDAARRILSSSSSLTNCKYRLHARSQTFNARDNVSQFIKWARHVACVREVLMFESDDLILRKNEKNFLLCLLEIARFGAKFGVSVPAIIKLEHEIEREIEYDKQKENFLFVEMKTLSKDKDENDANTIVDSRYCQTNDTDFNDVNCSEQSLIRTPAYSNNNRKQRQHSEESYDSITSSDMIPANITSNEESSFNHELDERKNSIISPASSSSSHLHKTVVQIANSCCCSQRFPVIRIGEGKYRIGESGTIIFIRILRNHVMVRVGGGWDTLENYLNKHDPCRRSAHRRSEHHDHSDIPILAIPNANISPSVQKNTPFGKSVTLKTEEFPLAKPSNQDTNLVDAQLVITRGADGRHRIGQITYKSEENTLNQELSCPQHHHHSSTPITKVKGIRSMEPSNSSSIYYKQSSPSTDQEYSSLTETTPSKLSSLSSLDCKDETIEQSLKFLNITPIENQSIRSSSPIDKIPTTMQNHINNYASINSNNCFIELSKQSNRNVDNLNSRKGCITESIIDTIDIDIPSTSIGLEHDFNMNDIEDVMKSNKRQISHDDTTNIDNDSLESSEGVLDEQKKQSESFLLSSTKRSNGYYSTFYLEQKQKFHQEQIANRKRSASNTNRYSSRSNTLPNVVEAIKKEEPTSRQRRRPISVTQRSQSTELIEKLNDRSKFDRDSGFDEHDFRHERLHSNGDDNSSVSSIKSPRCLTARSTNSEYRENKSYELRMKNLDTKRYSNGKESSLKAGRNSSLLPRRSNNTILPTPKYRKNSQPILNLK